MTRSLGDRMKRYETITRSVLLPNSLTVLRLDGRGFHRYLRDAAKPFDLQFVTDMQEVARQLRSEIAGTVFVYGQSDELSFVLSDESPESEPWFGGVVQKMVSVAASCATAHLVARRSARSLPHFDARVFTLPSWTEVANYIIWRQRDAVRNSVHMAARAYFPHSAVMGKNADQLQEMLWSKHNVNWNDYPDSVKRGWVLAPEIVSKTSSFVHTRTGKTETVLVPKVQWVLSSPYLTTQSPLFDPQRLQRQVTISYTTEGDRTHA